MTENNNSLNDPASAAFPIPSWNDHDFVLKFPCAAVGKIIDAQSAPLLYEIYRKMLDSLGIEPHEAPVFATVRFGSEQADPNEPEVRLRNHCGFYFPFHYACAAERHTYPATKQELRKGKSMIVIGADCPDRHTLETLLITVAHEIGHYREMLDEPEKAGKPEMEKEFQTFLSEGVLPSTFFPKLTQQQSQQSQQSEWVAHSAAIALMGPALFEKARRKEAAFLSEDLTLTEKEHQEQKTASHPHIKQEIQLARRYARTIKPITFIRKDGSKIER